MPPRAQARYFCYTDGSCKKGEGSPGGWGVVVRCPDGAVFEKYAGCVKTMSLTMELTAILEALKFLPPGAQATVFSDSKAALIACARTLLVLRGNGWKNAPAENVALLQAIDAEWVGKKLVISWEWIRSHNGNPGNERADELAAMGAREAKACLKSDA